MCWHASIYSWQREAHYLGSYTFLFLDFFLCMDPSLTLKINGGQISKNIVIGIIHSMIMKNHVIAATDL
jgi:hypothetical protein